MIVPDIRRRAFYFVIRALALEYFPVSSLKDGCQCWWMYSGNRNECVEGEVEGGWWVLETVRRPGHTHAMSCLC